MNITLPFNSGYNQQASEKMLPNGKFLRVENCRFRGIADMVKRPGYVKISEMVDSAQSPSVGVLNGATTLRYTGNDFEAYDPSQAEWKSAMSIPWRSPLAVQTNDIFQETPISSYSASVGDLDAAKNSLGQVGYVFEARYGSSTTKIILVVLASDGSEVARQEILSNVAANNYPRVVAVGTTFYVTYMTTTTTIVCRSYDPPTGVLGAAANITAGANSQSYAIIPKLASSTEFFVAYTTATPNITVARITASTLATVASVTIAVTPASSRSIALCENTVSGLLLSWRETGTSNIRVAAWTSSLGGVVFGNTLVAAEAAVAYPVCVDYGEDWMVAWSVIVSTPGSENSTINYRQVSAAGALSGTQVNLPGCTIGGGAFNSYGSYIVAQNSENVGACNYYLMELAPSTSPNRGRVRAMWSLNSAKILTSVAAGFPCTVVNLGSNRFWAGCLVGQKASENMGAIYADIDFGNARHTMTPIRGGLMIASGIPLIYDGATVSEATLLETPVIMSATTGGGTFNYSYKVVTKILNNNGFVVVSGDSLPLALPLANNANTINVKRYNFGARLPGNGNAQAYRVRYELYRTLNNGTVYYYVTYTERDYEPTAGIVAISDARTDTQIAANPVLYTQVGDQLPNTVAPPYRYMAVGDDRVLVGGVENKREIRWSKILTSGEGIQWSTDTKLKREIPETVTGVSYMDGVWYAFGKNGVYYTTGEGPDDAGSGAEFPALRKLPGSIGCSNGNSIVVGSAGIYFQCRSTGAIARLPRGGGSPEIVSDKVSSFLIARPYIWSAVNTTDEVNDNLIVFSCGPSSVFQTSTQFLVLDESNGEWCVDVPGVTLQATSLANSTNGRLQFTDWYNSYLYEQAAYGNTYLDNGAAYDQIVETGDIRPWGSSSTYGQFIRWSLVTGNQDKVADPGYTLKVEQSVDSGQSYSTMGSFSLTSSDDNRSFRGRFPKQKGESVRIKVTGLATGGAGSNSSGVALVALGIDTMAIGGLARLPSNRSAG